MGQDGYGLFSLVVQIPIRKAPKRSRSADLYSSGIIDDVCGENESMNSSNESSLPNCSDLVRTATSKIPRFDSRMKIVLAFLLCASTLLWNRWILDPYDAPTAFVNSRKTTTTSTAATITTKTKHVIDDASFREADSNGAARHDMAIQSDTEPPTISPSSTKTTKRASSSEEKSSVKPHVSVIQWSHWKDLERIVASIWEGNLFCTTIDDVVRQYYSNHTINITIQTNVTNTTTNITSTVPVVQQVVPPGVPIPTIHFGLELSCLDLFHKSTDGTGNYIEAIYMMRLALQYISYAKIQLNISCSDNTVEFQTNYVLPWFTGVWRSPNYFGDSKNGKTNEEQMQFQGLPPLEQQQQQRINMPQSLPKRHYCGTFGTAATGIMYPQMQYDVRRMALALTCNTRKIQTRPSQSQSKPYPHRAKVLSFLQRHVYASNSIETIQNITTTNTASSNTKTSSFKKQSEYIYAHNQQERISTQAHVLPLIQPRGGNMDPPLEFDDAVIHFRCGDLLSTQLASYGFLTFDGYSRHISKTTTRTIGILTQPFGTTDRTAASTSVATAQIRTLDSGTAQQIGRCRTLVHAFVDHLQERFPDATITIRNSESETIALAYARMVMATQVIGSMSTFSLFPILGTFGTGYYLRPKMYDPSMWLTHRVYPVTNFINPPSNFVLFDDANVLVGTQTKDLWDNHGDDIVLEWFRTGNYTVTNTSANE